MKRIRSWPVGMGSTVSFSGSAAFNHDGDLVVMEEKRAQAECTISVFDGLVAELFCELPARLLSLSGGLDEIPAMARIPAGFADVVPLEIHDDTGHTGQSGKKIKQLIEGLNGDQLFYVILVSHFCVFPKNELPRRRAAGYPKNIERPKGRGIKP